MKRWAFTIILFLLLGAIVNVVVAWGLCMFRFRGTIGPSQLRLEVSPDELELWRGIDAPVGVDEPFGVSVRTIPGYSETRFIGRGLIITTPSGNKDAIRSSANWNDAGWPMLALRGVWFAIPEDTTAKWRIQTRGAIANSWGKSQKIFPKRSDYLPCWPRWSGFAINTVFYAFILWLPFATLIALRRTIRRKYGHCAACGFNLHGSPSASHVCPECGAAVR